jgi:hypothetical protein
MVLDMVYGMTLNGKRGFTIAQGAVQVEFEVVGRSCRCVKYCSNSERKITGKLIGLFQPVESCSISMAWHCFSSQVDIAPACDTIDQG